MGRSMFSINIEIVFAYEKMVYINLYCKENYEAKNK